MTLLKSYYQLCKPNVVYMMLICAFVGMLLAEQQVQSFRYLFVALLGIAFCAASAAAVNQVIDRNTDASMTRTDQRPLPRRTFRNSFFNFCHSDRNHRRISFIFICKHSYNDSYFGIFNRICFYLHSLFKKSYPCLLYTSDAADE